MKIANLLARVSRISLDGENSVSGINENEPKWTQLTKMSENESKWTQLTKMNEVNENEPNESR